MKKYELFAVIKPTVDTDEVDNTVKKIEEIISNLQGNVVDTEKMGKKKLAYDVQGFKEGFMINQKFNLEEDKVKEFRRQVKLNENIIRTMFTQVK